MTTEKTNGLTRRNQLKLLGTGMAASVTGCLGGGGNGGGDDVREPVEYLTWGLDFMDETIQEWMDMYSEEYDLDAEVLHEHEDSFHSLVTSRIEDDEPPHVMDSFSTNYQRYLDLWEEDINRFYSDDELERFDQGVLSQYEDDGTYRLMPYYYQIQPMWYRRDIFDEAGIEPPETTFEHFETARTLVEDTDLDHGLTHFGPGWNYSWWTYFEAEGVSMLSDDNSEAAFDTSDTVEILEELQALTEEGVIAEISWIERKRPQIDLFADGNVGMMVSGGAELRELQSAGGEAFPVDEDHVALKGCPNGAGLFIPTGLGIPSPLNDANIEAGANLIKLLTSDDVMEEFLRVTSVAVGNVNAMDRLLDDDEWIEENPLIANLFELYGDIAGDAYTYPNVAQSVEIWDAVQTEFQGVVLEGNSAEDAVSAAASEVNNIL